MGVVIHSADNSSLTYSVVPEYVPEKETIKHLKELKKANMETNGYSKDRTLRRIGEIDYALYYNYALFNNVPNTEIQEWYTKDNGKNLKKLMNEYSHCKIVDKL